MENSDPEEEEDEDAAAVKLLDDEVRNKVADKKEDTDFRKNEDREVVLVDGDDDDDDVDAALVVVLAATVFTANIVLFTSSTNDVNSPTFSRKKNADITTIQAINIMLPAALNRKPYRRALILFFVLVIIPFSGRMFYAHKLEFARRVSLRLEEARREQNNSLHASSFSSSKMHTFQTKTTIKRNASSSNNSSNSTKKRKRGYWKEIHWEMFEKGSVIDSGGEKRALLQIP